MQEERPALARVKSSCTIKPAGTTPTHTLWLSDLDQLQPITHAPTLYFYPRTSNDDDDSSPFFSPATMKNALSQALAKFYPLAGRLQPGTRGRLQLQCNAMGALFVEAQSDARLDDFGDFAPRPAFRDLIPSVDYNSCVGSWPLVLVQLTFFSCGGVCLGLGICHSASDGFASLHFVSTWARIARGDPHLGPDPFFDRTLLRARDTLPAPAFEHEEFDPLPPLIGYEENQGELQKKETTVAMLKLSPEQVAKIREQAAGNSRVLAVAGHVWRTACRARRLHPDQQTKMSLSVNWRSRLNPPLPEGFFGNAMFVTMACARSGELVSEPLGYAASRVRKAVERMGDEHLRSSLEFLAGQEDLKPYKRGAHTEFGQERFYGCPNLVFTPWLGLPLYDADFGWGPPAHMGPAGVGFEGKVFLLPAREGDGGLVIVIRLMAEHMEDFKKLFYECLR